MSVLKEEWGFFQGYKVYVLTLKNKNRVSVKLTNYGAAIVQFLAPDKQGKMDDIVLGYDDLAGYVNGKSFQGAIAGRYANRIQDGKFTLNGKEIQLAKNDGPNSLHGGTFGYDKRVWTVKPIVLGEDKVTFCYTSPDGEENYPGCVHIEISYVLTEENELKILYTAKSDADTILNLTNHVYFNLGGLAAGDILDTSLQLFADAYTPVDDTLIPTGKAEPVEGTPFDFRQPRRIGDAIEADELSGYDHNFILGSKKEMRTAAIATDPHSGRILTTRTDMPAIQLYTGNGLDEVGKAKTPVGKYGGFCLETQYSPNTPNLTGFPSCVLKKGETFKSTTIYQVSVAE